MIGVGSLFVSPVGTDPTVYPLKADGFTIKLRRLVEQVVTTPRPLPFQGSTLHPELLFHMWE